MMCPHASGWRRCAGIRPGTDLQKTRVEGWNNLQILTDKLATRVLFDGHRAIAVEVLDGPRAYKADVAHQSGAAGAQRLTITARKEVILCGGAINSPQLLMLSGIGPAGDLVQHGIDVIRDLPGVGHHLQDHLEVGHIFEMKHLPDRVWRWQSTFLAEAGPEFAANADPSSFTENYIPLVMDWFSGFDAPNPMHPDLHIHVFTGYFRDFNLNPLAVVDSECRVLGVDGLRVCDASIFPELPAYNTSRPSYLVGEVLADLITSGSATARSRSGATIGLGR